jgi:hypothetical protein
MPLRRTLALATCVLAVCAPALTSCGFDYATDRIYTPATGVNNRDASVDVLGAAIVSADDGSGTFIASFANNDSVKTVSVESLEGVDQAALTADDFPPIEVPPGGMVNLADDEGIGVEGDDVAAGEFVEVTLQFDTGERVEMDIPVVTNCGYYEGLDGPPSDEQCDQPEPSPTEQ